MINTFKGLHKTVGNELTFMVMINCAGPFNIDPAIGIKIGWNSACRAMSEYESSGEQENNYFFKAGHF